MMKEKIRIVLLYLPTLNCNLRCKHCYLYGDDFKYKNIFDNYNSNVREDVDIMSSYSDEFDFNVIIHGGEPTTLSNLDDFEYLIEELHYKKGFQIGFQSNLFNLSDEWKEFLIKHKNVITRVSTSLEFPTLVHNEIRSNSYNNVKDNIKFLVENNCKVGIVSTIIKQNIINKELFISDFNDFKNEFLNDKNVMLKFSFGYSKSYSLNDEEQEIFANLLFDNKIEKYMDMYQKKDKIFDISLCSNQEFCNIFTFNNKNFNFCHSFSTEIKSLEMIKPIKKSYPAECNDCNLLRICWGGCLSSKIALKSEKCHFCKFKKIFFNTILEG